MKCVYVNLDGATARRSAIEASFSAVAPSGVTLERFAALDAARVADVAGGLAGPQKACFCSHRAAIEAGLDDGRPLFVLEDDAAFSPFTFPVLRGMLDGDSSWDILFTDVGFWRPSDLVELARLRRSLAPSGRFRLLDLRPFPFFAATAYVVRGSSKAKLNALLQRPPSLDVAFDLYLRQLVNSGEISAAVCFPFITTISADAEASQISPPGREFFDRTVNGFRRLMCAGRDEDRSRKEVEALAAGCDADARLVGAICAAIASERFEIGR